MTLNVRAHRFSYTSFLLGSLKKKLNTSFGTLHRKDKENLESIIGYYAKHVLTADVGPALVKTLKKLVSVVWRMDNKKSRLSYTSKGTFSDTTILQVIKAAFGVHNSAFFEGVARRHKGKLSTDFFKWAREQLRSAVLAYPDFTERLLAVLHLFPSNEPLLDEARIWVERVHDQMLEVLWQLELEPTQDDGIAIMEMAIKYHDVSYILARFVLPSSSSA
ncbi:hypothetical protein BO86DRAFT_397234 [Aspergillus japonicus CBS 114.51]|uniref:Uncharacterized protein n=1 Tax=Aspergillus japonicus CBS 114.51 TaxID=1448312 RepID=A0A8T8X881_ASPJA|nr:hypothetical protein BO86DRAFT_397234 [Aspergillus japonicus CBS 114.51]RAH84373.1 hypothetical protein BO86DRAFT_397234 [Aspergillus japonicus CBS 114.51]